MSSTSYFDAKANTWDSDPVKVARATAVADGIRQHVPFTADTTGLEYGCGTGLLSFALREQFKHITLADNSPGMLDTLRAKITAAGVTHLEPRQLDLTAGPRPEERFGVIYTAMTLHHIPDTDGILREFYALLETPGYLCIADLDLEDGSFHGPGFDGHNGFDRATLGAQARAAGFSKVHFETIFHMTKGNGTQTEFPIFLMVATKS